MIDPSKLDAKAARQERRIVAWSRGASRLIAGKVADAHAHAVKALTESLREEPDGRKTNGKVRRSKSANAAGRRLDELLDGLVGPSIDSAEGLLRDARERFLVECFADWSGLLEPEDLRRNPTPTEAERSAIRRHELHGLPIRMEVGGVIDRYSRSLLASIAHAAGRGLDSRSSSTILKTWEAKATAGVLSAVKLALSDSMVLADSATQWFILRPELRGDDDPPLGIDP